MTIVVLIIIDKFAISNTYFRNLGIACLLSGKELSSRGGWNNKLQFETTVFETLEKPQAHK